jgi:ArsR family transcriptional regulator
MESKLAVLVLSALAQDTRLAILRMLVRQGPDGLTVGRIGEVLGLAPATLSFHLRQLSHAGLVRARQQSRFIRYSANVAAMENLIGYLAENCGRSTGAPERAASEPSGIPPAAAKPVVRPKTRTA